MLELSGTSGINEIKTIFSAAHMSEQLLKKKRDKRGTL